VKGHDRVAPTSAQRTLYEQASHRPGLVRVVGKDGAQGLFDDRGRYLEGERRVADVAMCRVGRRRTEQRRARMADRAAKAGAGARRSGQRPSKVTPDLARQTVDASEGKKDT